MDGTHADSGSAGGMPDSDRILAALKASGELESLRTAAMDALAQDESLRRVVEQEVAASSALRHHVGDKPNRQLISQVQHELWHDLSAEALRCLWRVLTEGSVSQRIDEAIRAVLCQQHAEQLHAAGQQQQQQQQQQLPGGG